MILALILLNPQTRPTLIIVPSALKNQWLGEILRDVGNPPFNHLTYFRHVHQGCLRSPLPVGWMQKFEIVLTTHDILRDEYLDFVKSRDSFNARRRDGESDAYRGEFPLFTETFGRMVIDEADKLRNAGALLDAACEIKAILRNITTGKHIYCLASSVILM